MVIKFKDKFQLVGTKIQEFELPNSRGVTVNIRDLEKTNNVVVVLFRSIQWPFSREHADKLRRDFDKFKELDGYLFPILAERENNAKKMEEKYTKNYAVFYDKSKKVVSMLKQEVIPKKLGRMPALLIVDKMGIIRYAYYGDDMTDIPENEVILEILREINI